MSSLTGYLSFDPTDANTIASGASVGAFVRAGSDGTLIGHVADALKVDLASSSLSDFDIRDLTHVSDSVKIGDGTDFLAVNGDGSINAVVTATNLDIRDLTAASDSVASWLKDGSGNSISSTGGSLDVNVTNSIDIDDDLANTAIENTATAVSTTAVNVVASALANRKFMALANEGNIKLFFGKTGVTTSNGFPLYAKEKAMFRIGAAVAPQIIGGTGASSEDLRVMELS